MNPFKKGDVVTGIKDKAAPEWSLGKESIVKAVLGDMVYLIKPNGDDISGYYYYRFELACKWITVEKRKLP